MPHPSPDQERLARFTQLIGAEPRAAKFDDDGQLIELDLAGLDLVELPPEIGQFVHLQKLILGYLERDEDGRFKRDEQGQAIVLGNPLANLPSELWSLTNLQQLFLANNQLSILPSEIGKLANLQVLFLANNQLSNLPSELWSLTNLKQFFLDNNQLSSLPSKISKLANLQALFLNGNRLNTLPSEIGKLTNLEWLALSYNQLSSLPSQVSQLVNLQSLSLNHNPNLRTPPPEIATQDTKEILAFMRGLAQGAVTRYEAKLLLVGEGATGKSSLLAALQGEPFVENRSTTHGIAIQKLEVTQPPTSYFLNIWDFGGQQISHTTHQFFMTGRSLYLLVWNARGDTEQGRLDYWLRNIQVVAPKASVILVATHLDERPADFNFERFRQTYPQLVGQVGVSNKTSQGIEQLRKMIREEAAKLPLMEQQWPRSWAAAEGVLATFSPISLKEGDAEQLPTLGGSEVTYIDLSTYTRICEQAKISTETVRRALGGYLHDLGKILFYQDDDLLGDFIVLKPNWLTQAISRVLDDPITRDQNKGVLHHADFERLWPDQPRWLYPRFLRLMERFLISRKFENPIPGQEATRSLVPLLLPHTPPVDLPSWPDVVAGQPEIRMVFRLANFVPPGLMSWFIVLTHLYQQPYYWREGVRLEYEGHQAEAALNPSTRELWLRVCGPAPSNFFNLLQHTLNDRVLAFYQGLEYVRQVPCNCHIARGANKPCAYFHDFKRLTQRLRQGKLTAECGLAPFDEVSVPELLEGIHHSTKDRVLARLAEVEQNLLQGQGQLQQQLVKYDQDLQLLRDWFIRSWKLEEASLNADCPGTFVLMPNDRSRFNPKNLFSSQYTLYLLCQHRQGPHLPQDCQGYPVPEAREWWAAVAPWLKQVTDYLRYIPKAGLLAKAYDEQFYKDVETSLQIFKTALEELPSLEAADPRHLEPARSRFDSFTAEGPALRALHSFLKEIDPKEGWCGLHKVPTADGSILWLCDEHRGLYQL